MKRGVTARLVAAAAVFVGALLAVSAVTMSPALATVTRHEAEDATHWTSAGCWTATSDASYSGGAFMACTTSNVALTNTYTVAEGNVGAVAIAGRCTTSVRTYTYELDGGAAVGFGGTCGMGNSQHVWLTIDGLTAGAHTVVIKRTMGSGSIDFTEWTEELEPPPTTTTTTLAATVVELGGDQSEVLMWTAGVVSLVMGAKVGQMVFRGRS